MKVSREDYDELSRYKWYIDNGYVRNNELGYMHRVVMKAGKGDIVDHCNRDKSDNRRENLRFADHSQSSQNKGSGVRGVRYSPSKQMWRANISKDKTMFHLGYFSTMEDASEAYDGAARILYGHYAYLNNMRGLNED